MHLFSCDVCSASCALQWTEGATSSQKQAESTKSTHNITTEGFYFKFWHLKHNNFASLTLNSTFPTWQRWCCWTALIRQDDTRQQHESLKESMEFCCCFQQEKKRKLFSFPFFATFWCKKSVMAISTSHVAGSHPASCEGGKTDWKEIPSQRRVCSHLPARDGLPSHRFLSIIGFSEANR